MEMGKYKIIHLNYKEPNFSIASQISLDFFVITGE